MSSHDPERAYVQSRLDDADRQLADAAAEMRADLDRLAESWRSGYEQHLAEIEESRREYLRGLGTNDDGPPPSSQNRARPEPVDASLAGPSFPVGTAPAGHPDPLADDLQMAAAIRDMSMAEFQRSRSTFGIRAPESMDHLFGQETQ